MVVIFEFFLFWNSLDFCFQALKLSRYRTTSYSFSRHSLILFFYLKFLHNIVGFFQSFFVHFSISFFFCWGQNIPKNVAINRILCEYWRMTPHIYRNKKLCGMCVSWIAISISYAMWPPILMKVKWIALIFVSGVPLQMIWIGELRRFSHKCTLFSVPFLIWNAYQFLLCFHSQ